MPDNDRVTHGGYFVVVDTRREDGSGLVMVLTDEYGDVAIYETETAAINTISNHMLRAFPWEVYPCPTA